MSKRLRIAVIADLHAYSKIIDKKPSHFDINLAPDERGNVIDTLIALMDDRKVKSDYLFCCGDMGDKAEPAALKHCWEKLKELAHVMDARLIFTSGNHDLDSRYAHSNFDARGQLQALGKYPTESELANQHYWTYHYACVDDLPASIVTLNSAAYHGAVKFDKDGKLSTVEHEYGRISNSTLNRLTIDLKSKHEVSPNPLNILLCHHHPLPLDGPPELEDKSQMKGGASLASQLGSGDLGQWTVVHGHTHQPAVFRAAGGSKAPWIFSAGSFASLQTTYANQFYVLDFDVEAQERLGLSVACTFQAWTFDPGGRWKEASSDELLPACGGFGKTAIEAGDISEVATAYYKVAADREMCSWDELASEIEWLKYVQPIDIRYLTLELEKLGIRGDLKPAVAYQLKTLDSRSLS